MLKRVLIFLLTGFILTASIHAQVRYTVIPESPRPGDPVTIAVNTPITDAQLIVNGRQAAKAAGFTVPPEGTQPGFMAAILAVPSTVEAENAVIRLNNAGNIIQEIPVKITQRTFRSETLALTAAMSNLVTTPDPQRTIESERLWEILTTTGNQIYHEGPFVLPVTASTRRTSQFGTRRVNVYPDGRRTTDIHAGVDIGGPVAGQSLQGAEVFACGRGMVILSRMRILSGNSVIIEHAPGVYSIYYHLDSLVAREGAIVEAGALIGYVGSTGFSTGAHLHWELRISTENADPDAFVSRPLIDKALIISRIYNNGLQINLLF
ncbi:MAG: M23 family metallopeptidase [Treponema sp.]|jgi:murein DD-endopeptidase MepM/ murein hydrolase activator NlpD|nr:M23 family metallopeptidase [Treponema sp.]